MKFLLKLFFISAIFSSAAFSQTLVSSYPFLNYSQYNSFRGITLVNDTLYIGTDNNGSIYKVSKTGVILDSLPTPFNFNHGLAWDGSGFWIAEDYRPSGARLYKVNTSGIKVDSIYLPALIGGNTQGVGDIEIVGNSIWFSVYAPDFPSYPKAYIYEMDLTTRNILDTIPSVGGQPYGITIKGDTVLYAMDDNEGDPERIYAYSKSLGDTIFSFPTPDPDGTCNPKSIHWDGENLWLIADRIGGTAFIYKTLYKYDLSGSGSPIITTSSNIINFPNTTVNTTTNQNFTITNTGTADLIISSYSSNNPRFGITPTIVPDTLSPSESRNFTVSFSPLVYGNDSAQLSISSNDGGTPIKVVKLYGKGVNNGSFITLQSTSFNYNQRRVNSLCGYTFEVENTGNAPLNITSMSFASSRYWMDTTGLTFPVQIDTQRTRIFRVWFNPDAASVFTDSLTIQSNAVNLTTARINLSGSGNAAVTQLGDIMWQGVNPTNPNTSSNDLQPKSMKYINDVNGDGVNDLIVATENYWTICYNGNSSVTADTLWKFNTHFGTINTGSVDWQDAMQTIPDIDNDGVADVIIGCTGGNEMVYALSGRTGLKLWEYGNSSTTNDGDIMGIRTDRDYNGDSRNDVLISASGTSTGGRHAVICVNGLTGAEIFNVTQTAGFTYDIVATDFGGAVSLGNDGPPYLVNGFNSSGQSAWSYSVLGAVWCLRQVPDLNNDGVKDVMGYFTQSLLNGYLFAVTGDAGAELWRKDLGQGNNGNMAFFPDLDGNGFDEVIASGPQTIHRIDIKTDSVQWSYSPSASYSRGVDNIGDVNGDSIADVAVIMQNPPKVIVLDGSKGAVLFEYSLGAGINQRGDRIASIGDIENNNSNEFVAGSRDGRVICFSGGPDGTVGIQPVSNVIPEKFTLEQNYPNPFNPSTIIKFGLPFNGLVKLKVYDILGREVAKLVNNNLLAGTYEYTFDGSKLSSGVYFYSLEAADFKETKRMLLVK